MKVVIEYETKYDRVHVLDMAKEGVTDVAEYGGGWSYRPTLATILKPQKKEKSHVRD